MCNISSVSLLQTHWLSPLSSSSRMPAVDQVVSVSAAGGPSILWGYHQPLVDAEHLLLRGPIHSADREEHHRDQAAQHQPRAHSLHTLPCGRGSVMEANNSLWAALVRIGLHWHKRLLQKDLCNRLEAEREGGQHTGQRSRRRRGWGVKDLHARSWQNHHPLVSTHAGQTLSTLTPNCLVYFFPDVYPRQCQNIIVTGLWSRQWVFISLWDSVLCMHRHLRLSKYSTHARCSAEWQADSPSYVTSRYTVLCSLPLFLCITAEWEEQKCWQRGAWFYLKCLLWDCWGGPWKYLNLWKRIGSSPWWPFCYLLFTRLYIVYCCFSSLPLMGLDQWSLCHYNHYYHYFYYSNVISNQTTS